MSNLTTREEILATLAWQAAAGADEAVEDVAFDWSAPQTTLKSASLLSTAPAKPAAPAPISKPAVSADLSNIKTLDELKAALAAIEGLSIKDTAMNLVFGEGPLNPPIMFVGEAPGEEEDRSGRPFVGRAGQLLDKMIKAMGLTREQVYITNVLRWRPPGNRTPKSDEVAVCLPYLLRHIELVNPKLLVCLGGPAAKAILGRDDSVTRLRNQWFEHHSPHLQSLIPTRATYHPAYLLRTPLQKRESWRDCLWITKKLGRVESA